MTQATTSDNQADSGGAVSHSDLYAKRKQIYPKLFLTRFIV